MSVLDDMALGTRRYHKTLRKLCEPLQQYYGITEMGYVEIENDGRLINLHTHHSWLEHCLDKKYFIDDPHMVSPNNIGQGIAIWSTYKKDDYLNGMLKECVEIYGMSHGITFCKKTSKGYKLFGFGSPKENVDIHNKLINSMDCIKTFISYVDERIEPIRKKLDDKKIDFQLLKGQEYHDQVSIIPPQEDALEKYAFLEKLGIMKEKLNEIKLSKREEQCVNMYLHGMSATQTAKNLCISPRTVESHMESVKIKYNIKYKRELFDKFKILKEYHFI